MPIPLVDFPPTIRLLMLSSLVFVSVLTQLAVYLSAAAPVASFSTEAHPSGIAPKRLMLHGEASRRSRPYTRESLGGRMFPVCQARPI